MIRTGKITGLFASVSCILIFLSGCGQEVAKLRSFGGTASESNDAEQLALQNPEFTATVTRGNFNKRKRSHSFFTLHLRDLEGTDHRISQVQLFVCNPGFDDCYSDYVGTNVKPKEDFDFLYDLSNRGRITVKPGVKIKVTSGVKYGRYFRTEQVVLWEDDQEASPEDTPLVDADGSGGAGGDTDIDVAGDAEGDVGTGGTDGDANVEKPSGSYPDYCQLAKSQTDPRVWIVASNGTHDNPGTCDAPVSLAKAMSTLTSRAKSDVKPGDLVLLREGTYRGLFDPSLAGTSSDPIRVMPFVTQAGISERVTIDAYDGQSFVDDHGDVRQTNYSAIKIYTNHVIYYGIEFTSSSPEVRFSRMAGSHPTDVRRGSFHIYKGYNQIINCMIHDVQNIGWQQGADGGVMVGNIIYNIGWNGTDRGHGHGFYLQNRSTRKTIKGNIVFNTFRHSAKIYGSSQAPLNNVELSDNIFFHAGTAGGQLDPRAKNSYALLLGGGAPVTHSEVVDNMFYGHVDLGYSTSVVNSHLNFQRNYILSSRLWADFENSTISENLFEAPLMIGSKVTFTSKSQIRTDNPATDFNAYAVYSNAYDATRFHLAIRNPNQQGTVAIELPEQFASGDTYAVYHVFDIATKLGSDQCNQKSCINPVATGQVEGRHISIPMSAKPGVELFPANIKFNGQSSPSFSAEKDFGAFIICKNSTHCF